VCTWATQKLSEQSRRAASKANFHQAYLVNHAKNVTSLRPNELRINNTAKIVLKIEISKYLDFVRRFQTGLAKGPAERSALRNTKTRATIFHTSINKINLARDYIAVKLRKPLLPPFLSPYYPGPVLSEPSLRHVRGIRTYTAPDRCVKVLHVL